MSKEKTAVAETGFINKKTKKVNFWMIWGILNFPFAVMVKSVNPAIFGAVLLLFGYWRVKNS